MKNIAAVVTPLDNHIGVDIARSLGRRGIPVYGIDSDPHTPGRSSKYIKLAISPDCNKSEQDFIQFMVDFGRKLGQKAVLYPVRDDEVMVISKNRHELLEYYEVVLPEHAVVDKLLTKNGLRQAAIECGIPAPKTIIPHNANEVTSLAVEMNFPVILKPTESLYWHKPEIASLLSDGALAGHAKVVLCHDKDELYNFYQKIAVYDDRMVIQEVIPGEDERLVYFASYTNRNSETIASFAGRKIRVIPAGFGSASYVKTFYDPALKEVALKLLSGVKYQGPSGIEFKLDPRDNLYKLVEVNARFGLWDGLSVKLGIDLPYVYYRDALGIPVEPAHTYPEGIIWVDYYRDIRAFLTYHRLGKLSLSEWLRSLKGEKMVATYAPDDWRPFLSTGSELAARLVREQLLHRQ